MGHDEWQHKAHYVKKQKGTSVGQSSSGQPPLSQSILVAHQYGVFNLFANSRSRACKPCKQQRARIAIWALAEILEAVSSSTVSLSFAVSHRPRAWSGTGFEQKKSSFLFDIV